MQSFNAHQIKEPGYYWHVPDRGEGWPMKVLLHGERFAGQKIGDEVAYPLAGSYFWPLTTAAIQDI